MLTLALWVALAATPFPLPSIDEKPLAVTEGQTKFLVPLRFETMREFYTARLADPKVTLALTRVNERRVLTVVSLRPSDGWKKAVIREGSMGTEVEVTPVIRVGEQQVLGNGKPLVEFVLGRSRDVDRAVEKIGDSHVEAIRQ